ncbi:MAG: HrpE/YscL family type III secretion apparatus protein [Hyphomonas sp.]
MSYWRIDLSSDHAVFSDSAVVRKQELHYLEKAADVLRGSEESAAQAVDAARAQGYADGLSAGRAEARAELQAQQLKLTKQHHAYTENRDKDAIKMAFEVLRRLGEGLADSEKVRELTLQIASQIEGEGEAEVRVAPEHVAQVTASLAEHSGAFHVMGDAQLSGAEIKISTAFGEIDGTWDIQLTNFETLLLEGTPDGS